MQTGCAKGPAVNLWRQAVGQAGGQRDFLSWRLPHFLRGRTLSASRKRTHPLDRLGILALLEKMDGAFRRPPCLRAVRAIEVDAQAQHLLHGLCWAACRFHGPKG